MTETPEVRAPGASVPGYLLPLSILATILGLLVVVLGIILGVLLLSILAALLCLPAGILSTIFSVQASSKSQAGNYAGASQAVRRAKVWLIVSVVLGVLLMLLAFVFGLLGSPAAFDGGDEDIALRDLVQEQAGVFRLQDVREYPEGTRLGAESALTATYEGPGGTSLTNNLLDMPSPERADELRQQRVQEQQRELGLRVASEEPVENDEGEQLGTVTVLAREAAGSTVMVVSWTNEDLYSEATSEGSDAETFFEEVDY